MRPASRLSPLQYAYLLGFRRAKAQMRRAFEDTLDEVIPRCEVFEARMFADDQYSATDAKRDFNWWLN